jgi:hypothetical protein
MIDLKDAAGANLQAADINTALAHLSDICEPIPAQLHQGPDTGFEFD